MHFKQWQQCLDGTKTQTRRLKKEGERLKFLDGMKTIFTAKGRIKWQVGRIYAVQPGRGQNGRGRIKLLDIDGERLQDIGFNDMLCEGYPIALYSDNFDERPTVYSWFVSLWNSINKRAGDRWADNPEVWALTFELAG